MDCGPLDEKNPPDVVEELTVLLKDVVELDALVEPTTDLSSSRSFNFKNTLVSCL